MFDFPQLPPLTNPAPDSWERTKLKVVKTHKIITKIVASEFQTCKIQYLKGGGTMVKPTKGDNVLGWLVG